MNAIRFCEVTKRYPSARRDALAGLDLTLGCEHAIVLGPNGAGKSTLFRVVLGLERPTSGSVRWDGTFPSRIGYAPELPALPDSSRLFELLKVVDPIGKRSGECLALFELEETAEKRVERLSKGERQRASLALAFAAGAPLLVLDEPFEGLDPIVRPLVRAGIARALRTLPSTIVLASTHRTEEVALPFSRVIVLSQGRVVQDMSLHRLRELENACLISFDPGIEPSELRRRIHGCVAADGAVRAVRGYRDDSYSVFAGPFTPDSIPAGMGTRAGLEGLLQVWLGEDVLK